MLNQKTKSQLKIDEFIPKIFIRNPNQNNLTKQQIFLINKEAEYFYSIVANLIDVLAVDMTNKDPMASYRAKKAIYNHVISKEQLLDDSDQNFIDEIGLCIFDEAHLFDDPSRGTNFELLLSTVKQIFPKEIQKITTRINA